MTCPGMLRLNTVTSLAVQPIDRRVYPTRSARLACLAMLLFIVLVHVKRLDCNSVSRLAETLLCQHSVNVNCW